MNAPASPRAEIPVTSAALLRVLAAWAIMLGALDLTGCGRAPSFDLFGSFFPAWLVCLAAGLLLTAVARWLFLRLHIVIALPVLTYPSLAVLITLALWLAFFR